MMRFLLIIAGCIAITHQNSDVNCLRKNPGILDVTLDFINQREGNQNITADDIANSLTLLSQRFKRVHIPQPLFLEATGIIANGMAMYINSSNKHFPVFLNIPPGKRPKDINSTLLAYKQVYKTLKEINSEKLRPSIAGLYLVFLFKDFKKQLEAVEIIFGRKEQSILPIGHHHPACLNELKTKDEWRLRYLKRLDFLACLLPPENKQTPEEYAEEVINQCDKIRDTAISLNVTAEIVCFVNYYSQGTNQHGTFGSLKNFQKFWCSVVGELVSNQSHAGILMDSAFDRTPRFFREGQNDQYKPIHHTGWWRKIRVNDTYAFVEKVEELPGGTEYGKCKEDCNLMKQRNSPAKTSNHVDMRTIGFLSISIITGILIVGVIGFLIHRKINKNKMLSRQEVQQFFEGTASAPVVLVGRPMETYELVDDIPYDPQLEVALPNFEIYQDSVLGSGSFGIVVKGRVENEQVAVKTIPPGVDKVYLRALMLELKVLSYLGQHPHIINLKGAHTSKLTSGKLYLLLELSPSGNLLKFLRIHRNDFVDTESSQELNRTSGQQHITKKHLLQWSIQIASAMVHLSEKRIIHGDIAARNVLVFSLDQVKLTDFGLSRRIYEFSNYVKKKQVPLPWRHMSVEALRDLNFSLQSDVWAFGVMMWEIFSLGDVPFPGLNWTVNTLQLLIGGLRPLQPNYAHSVIYEVMTSCWSIDVHSRPPIALIHSKLTSISDQLFANSSYFCP